MLRCIKINTVTSTADNFLLETTITNATIFNGQKVRFCIHADIPATTTVAPVSIVINGEKQKIIHTQNKRIFLLD